MSKPMSSNQPIDRLEGEMVVASDDDLPPTCEARREGGR